MHRAYIDLGIIPHPVRAGTSGTTAPALSGILGTELDIGFAFMRNSTQEAIAAGTTGGKFTLKKKGDYTGAALLLDVAWAVVGAGAASVYQFTGTLDSDELIAAGGTDESIELIGNVEWLLEGAAAPSKTLDFIFTLYNSTSRPDDTIPASTDARWAWLKEAAPEANGFTHDDDLKTLEVDAGGTPAAHAASHAAAGGDPVTLAQSQITNLASDLALKAALASPALTGTPTAPTAAAATNTTQVATTAFVRTEVANLVAAAPGALDTLDELAAALGDDANYASTVTTALSGKEPTQTAASQAEAEAGTEAAIRKWSPLRVKQAITALGGGGGGANIVRGSGVLQGYTTPEVPASSPPLLVFSFDAFDTDFLAQATIDGTTYYFTFSTSDPANGTIWIDTTSHTGAVDTASALVSAVNALAISGVTAAPDNVECEVSNSNTGPSATLSGSVTNHDNASVSGGGSGVNFVAGSGDVSEVELIGQDGSKTVKPLKIGIHGTAGVVQQVEVALKTGGNYYPLGNVFDAYAVYGEIVVNDKFPEWRDGRASASLIARFSGATPDYGDLTIWAITEQN